MATVGKKFTDPDKWDTAWFTKLPPDSKLLYMYLWDRCDHSGVIEFIPTIWSAHLGQQIDGEYFNKFVEKVNVDKERIAVFDDKVWLTQYIRFQQKPDRSKPIAAGQPLLPKAYRLLKEHELLEEFKERDPIALTEYEEENGLCGSSKPSPSHDQANGKASESHSQVSNKNTNTKANTDKNGNTDTNNTQPESNKGNSYYQQVKQNIDGLAFSDLPALFESDVDEMLEEIESSGIKEPKSHLLERVKTTDWKVTTWTQFKERTMDLQDLPF